MERTEFPGELRRLARALQIEFLMWEEQLLLFRLYRFQLLAGLAAALLGFSPGQNQAKRGLDPVCISRRRLPSAALPQRPNVVVVPSKHRDVIREKRKKNSQSFVIPLWVT